ncbi:multidrug resistance protein MdtA [Sideroxyarcus emersonii]|uniref:Multidrug resistance protein MdtA n=1 Tax=Sideroxyarcus emersonii TaxID=2764705 RepID=A0AAN1XAL6_9PROT|nr:efflux RND transporter periplasmic adaptor subunit [Sideroxyarcus emersonii]BCK87838.1 multidrug resistance protein MdtA [Sideroxyarcus emersonii]
MNTLVKTTLAVLLLLGVAAAGYWFGIHAGPAAKEPATAPVARKVLYYRNPMGLPDTSPQPKKDAMGMDYVPVYEGDAEPNGQFGISLDKVQKLGVKSEAAAMRELDTALRVTGRIEVDERRTYTIAPKFEGWVEHLYANTTGQAVGKGQPLFDVYSPELVSAQREHALAQQGLASMQDADDAAKKSMQQLVTASAARLKNWDIAPSPQPADETAGHSTPRDKAVQGDGGQGDEREKQSSISARPHVTFRSPVSGIVLDKKAIQGMRFSAGEPLYQIADLASVWVIADVPEQDIGQVRPGSRVQVGVDAWPGRSFDGKVAFVYPTLDNATRTVPVRMEIANPHGLLKPAMFARARIETGASGKVLAVPASAVIDSGNRQVVLVRLAEGRFEPRTVTTGKRGDDYIQIESGIAEGEQVVTAANFLLDSESNLKAALGGMDEHAGHAATPTATTAAGRPAPAQPVSVGHQASGTLDAINGDGTVSVTHGPIGSLGWPGMTMDFALANPSLVAGIKPGSAISFELVERKPGEYVITRLQAQHEGH